MINFYCLRCGEPLEVSDQHAGKRSVCPSCNQVIQIPSPGVSGQGGSVQEPASYLQANPQQYVHQDAQYASAVQQPSPWVFPSQGRRLAGMVIDFFLIYVIIRFVALGVARLAFSSMSEHATQDEVFEMVNIIRLVYFLSFIGSYAFMESVLGGSLGKLMLGMKVVDRYGNSLSAGRATLRALARFVSMSMLWIGCLFFAFNKERQNLHCKWTKTYVVMK